MDKALQTSLLVGAFVVSAFATIIGIWMSRSTPLFALLPVLIFAGLLGAYGAIAAADGRRWALMLFVPAAIFVMSSTWRIQPPPGTVGGGGGGGGGYDLQSMTKFGFYCLSFLIGGFGLRYARYKLYTPTGILLMLYAAWAAVTALYSPTPDYTVAAAFGIMGWTLLAAAVGARLEPRDVLLVLLVALSMVIIVSWPVYLFVPSLGRMHFGSPNAGFYRFSGIAGQPNAASQIAVSYMAILAAFVLSRFHFSPERRLLAKVYFGGTAVLAFGILILSDSRGSLLAFVGVCLAIFVQKTRSAPIAVLAILLFTFVMFAVPNPLSLVEGVIVLLSRSGDVGELFELTGRVEIWAAVRDEIMLSPILGHGYGASREIIPLIYANRYGQTVGSAHNFLLQSLLEVGLIGTLLLVAVFVTCAIRFFTRPNYFRDTIFVIALSTGLVESGVSNSANVILVIWFFSMFYEAPDERRSSELMTDTPGPEPHGRARPAY